MPLTAERALVVTFRVEIRRGRTFGGPTRKEKPLGR
jgi:hypothetical protein